MSQLRWGPSTRPGTFLCGRGPSTPSGTGILSPDAWGVPLRDGMHPAARNVPARRPHPQVVGAPTDYSGIPRLKIISNGTTPVTRIDNSTTSTKISDPFSVRDMPWCFPMLSAPGSPFRMEAR